MSGPCPFPGHGADASGDPRRADDLRRAAVGVLLGAVDDVDCDAVLSDAGRPERGVWAGEALAGLVPVGTCEVCLRTLVAVVAAVAVRTLESRTDRESVAAYRAALWFLSALDPEPLG